MCHGLLGCHIRDVFAGLRKHKLKLKVEKCHFVATETVYLGFIVGKNGVKPIQKGRSYQELTCTKIGKRDGMFD